MDATDKVGLWLITTDGGNHFVIWSEPYKLSEKKAIAKWRRLTKGRLKKTVKVTARLMSCPVDGCWTFATQLLTDEELQDLPKEWWTVGDVELRADTDKLEVTSVCPMCEKHARRFRKTLGERILRIEERLDDLERYQEES